MACSGSVGDVVIHADFVVVSDDAVVVVDCSCSVGGLDYDDVGSVVAVDSSPFEGACWVHSGYNCSEGCCAGSCPCWAGYLEASVGNFGYVAAVESCSLDDCASELLAEPFGYYCY